MTSANVINIAIQILIYLIIARSILSFIPHNPYQPVWRFIYDITDPMLKPFRRFSIGGGGMGVDFSPLLAILVLQFIIRPVLITLISLILPF